MNEKCQSIKEILSVYLDNEVSEDERSDIDTHLETCEECRKELDRLRSCVESVQDLPRNKAPVGLAEEILEKFDSEGASDEAEKSKITVLWPRVTAVAASFLLVIALLLLIDIDKRGPTRQISQVEREKPEPTEEEREEIEVAEEEMYDLDEEMAADERARRREPALMEREAAEAAPAPAAEGDLMELDILGARAKAPGDAEAEAPPPTLDSREIRIDEGPDLSTLAELTAKLENAGARDIKALLETDPPGFELRFDILPDKYRNMLAGLQQHYDMAPSRRIAEEREHRREAAMMDALGEREKPEETAEEPEFISARIRVIGKEE